jgi:hypothetical protein
LSLDRPPTPADTPHMGHRRRLALLVGSILFAASFLVPNPTVAVAGAAAPTADRTKVGVSLYGSVLTWSSTRLSRELDHVKAMGARWVRVSFDWSTLQMHGPKTYNWTPADRVVAAANRRKLYVLAVVSYTPGWARPPGTDAAYPPTNVDHYAKFLHAAAKRYAPKGVHRWEIWNEPNISSMWKPVPSAKKYTALLRAAYWALHSADPKAVVVAGGLSPAADARNHSQIAPYTFLRKIYEYGGRGAFNQVGLHPYSFPYPSTEPGAWNPFRQAVSLHALMKAHGDGGKRVSATEFGFPTGTSDRAIGENLQAKYLVSGVRSWQAYVFDAPLFVYSMFDEGDDIANFHDNFGLVRYSRDPKPSYFAMRRALLGY